MSERIAIWTGWFGVATFCGMAIYLHAALRDIQGPSHLALGAAALSLLSYFRQRRLARKQAILRSAVELYEKRLAEPLF